MVAETRETEPGRCSEQFVAHDLPHRTGTDDGVIEMYEANGSGVALADFDRDGDLDIALAGYDENSILWNEGALNFRKEVLFHGGSRAVLAVDLDGDGWTDLLFSRIGGALNFFSNRGDTGRGDTSAEPRFVQETVPGISAPVYALAAADLDGDLDLDLVSASYDIGLLTEQGSDYLLAERGGLYLHFQEEGNFRSQRLTTSAQALALSTVDLDDDGRIDVLVGNDFAVPDEVWLNREDGWEAANPFAETSYSTMSFDWGDLDNRDRPALFASDMKPYATDPTTLARWAPLIRSLWFSPEEDDPQRQENVLNVPAATGEWENQAYTRRIDATGWSWSGLFGDLDQDGRLDLYVVNGFIEAETFAYLPDHELVEENQVLRNRGGDFERRPDWGLGSLRSGRGMAQGDLDGDGDLDIVINNLRDPAQLFENQLCAGRSLQVDLRWPESGNTGTVGATVYLESDDGRLRRDVQVARGYLSGDSGRLHFGFPEGTSLHRLEVHWPDGAISHWEDPPESGFISLTRTDPPLAPTSGDADER